MNEDYHSFTSKQNLSLITGNIFVSTFLIKTAEISIFINSQSMSTTFELVCGLCKHTCLVNTLFILHFTKKMVRLCFVLLFSKHI